MLLVFAPDFRAGLSGVLRTSGLRDALSNLALAHHEGKHIVSGPSALLADLADARELSQASRDIFRKIKVRHHEAKTLRESVSHYALIEARDGDIQENPGEGQRCFRVPLEYFSDSGRVQASRLVAENRNDARVYQRAADAFVSRATLKGLGARFQIYGGGGSTTAGTLRDHALQGPTACIVDADYKWSSEEGAPVKGETAAGATRVAAELAGKTMCIVYAAQCREIENLLPPSIVMDCFSVGDRGDFCRACVRASELGLLGGGPDVNRVDLKNGLSRKGYEANPPEHPQHRYETRVIAEHRDRAARPAGGWCGEERRCIGDKKCECFFFAGVGDGLLAQVADRLEKLTPQKVAEHLLASGQPHELAWTEIGSLLFAWGCAYPRTRT
jgi:hypothetical protein